MSFYFYSRYIHTDGDEKEVERNVCGCLDFLEFLWPLWLRSLRKQSSVILFWHLSRSVVMPKWDWLKKLIDGGKIVIVLVNVGRLAKPTSYSVCSALSCSIRTQDWTRARAREELMADFFTECRETIDGIQKILEGMAVKIDTNSELPVLIATGVVQEPVPKVEPEEPFIETCKSSSRAYHGANVIFESYIIEITWRLRFIAYLSTGNRITRDRLLMVQRAVSSVFIMDDSHLTVIFDWLDLPSFTVNLLQKPVSPPLPWFNRDEALISWPPPWSDWGFVMWFDSVVLTL